MTSAKNMTPESQSSYRMLLTSDQEAEIERIRATPSQSE
jgi:hypothetical protein